MWFMLAEVGILAGVYVYHRWFEDPPPTPPPAQQLQVPTSQAGAPIPLVYGQVKVNGPIMSWWGTAQAITGGTLGDLENPWDYGVDMLFNIGIPFSGGSCNLLSVWSGSVQMTFGAGSLQGSGGVTGALSNFRYSPCQTPASTIGAVGTLGGQVEFLDGDANQFLVDPTTHVATTWTAIRMIAAGVPYFQLPGMRGYASIFLFGPSSFPWIIGPQTQPDSYAFEMNSLPAGFGSGLIGQDVNPVDVIFDLLCGVFGKLGIDPGRLNTPSFVACAATLNSESHGFSRCWNDAGQTAMDLITEVLQQIDGVIYEDPTTGLICLKLIRPDYDVTTLPTISPSNCKSLDNFTMSGWVGLPNMMTISFTDRQNNYQAGTGVSQNQGNAVGQDGETYQVQLQMPGICTQALANEVASRELTARSRPLFKCTAEVSRDFYRTVIGDPLILSWPEANISHMVVRVAAVDRGTLADGTIKLALIQDYFYQWKNFNPVGNNLGVGLGSHGVQTM